MASLELRNKTYRVVFMFRGRKYGYSLDTGDRETAEGLLGGVEKTLMLVSQGALTVPEGADVVEFVRHGGKLPETEVVPPPAPLALEHGQFRAWLRGEFGWSERMAQNFMSVAERFGPKTEIIADLTIQLTVVYLLAAPSVPDRGPREGH